MNEIDIIRGQLDTERAHLSAVSAACARALEPVGASGATDSAKPPFFAACGDYFEFALTRVAGEAHASLRSALQSARTAAPDVAGLRWREFLDVFGAEFQRRKATIEALAGRNPLVTEWRATALISADSIFAERACYERFKASIPK